MGEAVINESLETHVPWTNVIFNPPVLDCLLEHMLFDDVKRLRTTCKQLNELITSRKNFASKAVFVVCESSHQSKENSAIAFRTLDILQSTTVKWRNLKIVLYNDFFKVHLKKEKDRLTEIIKDHVEHMTIIGTKRFMRTLSCVLFLMEEWQIPNCANLSHLSMDFNLLNSLLITGFSFLTDQIKQINILESKFKSEKGDDYDILTANLEVIAQKCKRLEKFTIKNGYAPLMNKPEVKKQLFNILHGNAGTLTAIEWLCDPIVGSQEFEVLAMPKLKEIQAYCSNESLTINNFIRHQENLEKLSVVFFKKLPSYPIDQILKTILKFKKTLKSFTVTFCSLESTNWNALEQMESLQSFYVFGMQDEGGVQRFTQFPQSLKGLVLREVTLYPSFYNSLWSSSFPFKSMTTVCLMGVKPTLTDEDMQAISSMMINLKVLQISGAPKVSDVAIIGNVPVGSVLKQTEINVPLSNLKNIRELTLNSFPQLTTRIQTALNFPCLRRLQLLDNDALKLTENFLALLITQNPRLEKVYFSERSLPKYKRGGFLPLQNFVARRSNGRCSLVENQDKEEVDEFEIDNEEESELDSEENMVLTAEEDEYEDENECLDEEEDDDEGDSDY